MQEIDRNTFTLHILGLSVQTVLEDLGTNVLPGIVRSVIMNGDTTLAISEDGTAAKNHGIRLTCAGLACLHHGRRGGRRSTSSYKASLLSFQM